MEPDSKTTALYCTLEQTTLKIFKTTCITVAFTACNSYKTKTTTTTIVTNAQNTDSSITKEIERASVKKAKTIYITFDDGPNIGTKNVRQLIEEEKIPVTAFVIGEHVLGTKEQKANYDSIKICKYFEIANHSYTHAFKNKFSLFYNLPDSVIKDFKKCADSLQLNSNLVRTPGRNIWRTANVTATDVLKSSAAADSIYKNGFIELGWDLEWRYTNSLKLIENCDEMLNHLNYMFEHNTTKTPSHLVFLTHDQLFKDSANLNQLRMFIKKLKQSNEYNFEFASKYPQLK